MAEKRAALEVVQKRMTKIGVGNHCLELHSDKTEKTKVLEQLRKAMDPCKECDSSKLDEMLSTHPCDATRVEHLSKHLEEAEALYAKAADKRGLGVAIKNGVPVN